MVTAANQRFPYRLDRVADAVVLRLDGTHYHADSFDALRQALEEAGSSAAGGRVVVDLGKVVLISSTVLRVFRAAHLALAERGGALHVAGGGELVANVLKFAPFIRRYETVDEAAAGFGAARGEENR